MSAEAEDPKATPGAINETPSEGSGAPDSSSEPSAPSTPSPTSVASATATAVEAEIPWPDDDERWLWIDPLAGDIRLKAGAVLLDDVIKDYVTKHSLLMEKTHFNEGKLKGGSYSMTPAEDEAWTFVPRDKWRGDRKIALEKGEDDLGKYYVVPRNSLVYIKLKQRLRLPFYIIGRHNLKIRYVYKGLLLGTGPQVDPGFEGNLFIPLHNFTTSEAKIYFEGEESSFVSIDFVRTTHFIDKSKVSARTVDELRRELGDSRKLIDLEKIKKRRTLEQYLGSATPRSQMSQFDFEFQKLKSSVKRDLRRIRTVALLEFLVVAGVIITGLAYFHDNVADLKLETKEVKNTTAFTNVVGMENKIESIAKRSEADVKTLATSLTNALIELQARVKQVELTTAKDRARATNVGAGKIP